STSENQRIRSLKVPSQKNKELEAEFTVGTSVACAVEISVTCAVGTSIPVLWKFELLVP
ncbi:73_t:CDS:2, partial [Gigaspora rosea]